MAIPRATPEQRREVASFIDRLYEISGAETNVEFASRAGLYASNVGEYRDAKAMPNAYTLLRLMRSVGAEVRARDTAVDLPALPDPRVRPGELPRAVGELLDWQESVMGDLDELRTRLEALETAPASRQATRRKKTG